MIATPKLIAPLGVWMGLGLRLAASAGAVGLVMMAGCSEQAEPAAAAGGGEVGVAEDEPASPQAAEEAPAAEEIAWKTLPTGLEYRDIVVGDGPTVGANDSVRVHLRVQVRTEPAPFVDRELTVSLTDPNLARGIRDGLLGVAVGSTREMRIPPDLAYAGTGREPTVPADAWLDVVAEVRELLVTP